jgi:hypothetical protein
LPPEVQLENSGGALAYRVARSGLDLTEGEVAIMDEMSGPDID